MEGMTREEIWNNYDENSKGPKLKKNEILVLKKTQL
jgi:hypothetical protein